MTDKRTPSFTEAEIKRVSPENEAEVLLRAEWKRETCEEFADDLHNNYFFDSMVEDAYWNRSFHSDEFFTALKEKAESQKIILTDVEEWNYDKYFYNLYQCSEKGLS